MSNEDSEKIFKQLSRILKENKVLGSPTRTTIMILLYFRTRMKFTEIQKLLDLTPGNLSSHLQKLKEAGYIEIVKGFANLRPATIIRITPEGIEAIRNYMRIIKRILEFKP
ncbi:MAG: transcriptional regulator [Candidatus Njordarchaeales archaeon]